MSKAFEGIRVVDFTQVLAGPFATAQLALLGADVIKIEQPGGGDMSRRTMTDAYHADRGMGPLFLSQNAGKRSLTLDLKHEAAAEIVHRLVRDADVVVQNFRAGVIDRLNFGYDTLKALNPRLIYCSVSGYGQEGPKSAAPAFDGAIQAASGFMSMTGHEDTGPTRSGCMVVDVATGITAAYVIASALFRREVSGEGQFLDVAMMDSILTFMSPLIVKYTTAGELPGLLGNLSPTRQPTADVFPTRDGHVMVVALTDIQVAALCKAIERPDLLKDARFSDQHARLENGAEMREEIIAALAAEDTATWLSRMGAAGLPVEPIRNVAEALADPQLDYRDIRLDLPAPTGLEKPITIINAGFKASDGSPGATQPPPALGEQTDAVLSEIGFDAAAIADLRATGAI